MTKKVYAFMRLLEEYFTNYLPVCAGLSKNTIKSYKYTFKLLLQYIFKEKNVSADHVKFEDLTVELIENFLKWLESERNCGISTRNQRLAALSAYSKYAQDRNTEAALVFRNAITQIPIKRGVTHKRSVFSREEIKILLELPNEKYASGLRDKVLLSVLYGSGARAQELCNLKVKDVINDNNKIKLRLIGKGNKSRTVLLPENCAKLLKCFMNHRKLQGQLERHVFSSQTHEQMTVSCIEMILKKYVAIAKNKYHDKFTEKSYSPHSLRHSFATHLIEAKVPLIVVKNILGHASLSTTEVYIQISQEQTDNSIMEWNKNWISNFKTEVSKESQEKDSYPTGEVPDFLAT
ncbi:tyrosine-type recombinase/integrase [Succinivibrio dextrinosolvens]|uniref:Site-specific recombinase XerD n=1 Tax=Succinivibrio dextrinosolvens TaxID=83771 RepID=A0A662ZGW3_9GAMM|nr:tyrosine-type recombinase/integrase [Succinivibrio dextrinosolvens]SFK58442.1 Site-specific recombinase XerD [Succinivibrio dextrinosolvens]